MIRSSTALLLISLGCRSYPKNASDTASEPANVEDEDQGEGAEHFTSISSAKTAVSTVIRVNWTTDEPTTGHVEVDSDGYETRITGLSETESTTHSVLLLGLRSAADFTFNVVATHGEETWTSETQEVSTDPLPPRMPALEVEYDDESLYEHPYIATNILMEDHVFSVILDRSGNVVWYRENLSDTFRVHPKADGGGIAYMGASPDPKDAASGGQFGIMDWEGNATFTLGEVGLHTDFTPIGDGVYMALTWDIRDAEIDGETKSLMGDTILKIDTTTGEQTTFWSTWDQFDPEVFTNGSNNFSPFLPEKWEVYDWTHGNGLSYDAEQNQLGLSMAGIQALAVLNATTAETVYTVADHDATYLTQEGQGGLRGPHGMDVIDGGFSVFNRSPNEYEDCSAAESYQLNEDLMEAERTWYYETDDCLVVIFLGNADKQENGNHLVVFSSSGRIVEITPDGETAWSVSTPIGSAFGFGNTLEDML